MSRWTAAAVAGLLASTGSAWAQQAMRAEVYFWEYGGNPVGMTVQDWEHVRPAHLEGRPAITTADYPADAIARGDKGRARLRIRVEADDRASGCVAVENDAPEALGRRACDLLLERGKFTHALGKDGKPAAGDVDMIFVWALIEEGAAQLPPAPSPPAPPTPPGEWPVMRVLPGITVAQEPDWKAFAPKGRRQGTATIGMMLERDSSILACHLMQSSGDAALDAASCEAAKTGRYAMPQPAYARQGMLVMRVEWRGGRTMMTLPTRPIGLDPRTGNSAPPLPAGLDLSGVSNRYGVMAFVRVSAAGKVLGCQLRESSGSDSVDSALCAAASAYRFEPATDVFGDKVEGVGRVRFSFPKTQ